MGYIHGELRKDSDLGIICVEYTKKYISSHYRKIMLKTDGSGNVTSVYGDFIQGIDLSLKKDEFFEGLWIDVPTPFHKKKDQKSLSMYRFRRIGCIIMLL